MSDAALIDTAAFDRVSTAAAEMVLRPACASVAWVEAMAADRPYSSFDALVGHSDEVLAELTWPDVEEALAAHPRIGERATGDGIEAGWSQQEQSGAMTAEESTAAALRAGNIEYEERFGHVFLICATGRTAEQMLAALRERLGHDADAERDVVRAELTAIVRLRLAKILR